MKEICLIVLDLESTTPLAEIRVQKCERIAMIAGINVQQGFQSPVLQSLVGEFVHNIIIRAATIQLTQDTIRITIFVSRCDTFLTTLEPKKHHRSMKLREVNTQILTFVMLDVFMM